MSEIRSIRRKDDDGRREALVAAAARVIARDGIGAATTRRIASEAGLPLGMVHYWFGGKEELLAAVVESAVEDLKMAALSAQAATEGATERPDLRDSFRAGWQVVLDDEPGRQLSLYELTTVALRTPGMEELAAQQYAAYRKVATDAIQQWYEASGTEFPGGLEALGRLIAVVFDGTALAWLADPGGTHPEQVFDLLSDLLERATSPKR